MVQYCQEAEKILEALKVRLEKFSLELSAEKIRLIEFGRYSRINAERKGKKPAIFDFLGFTHYADISRKGKYKVGLKTRRKKFTAKLKELKMHFREGMNMNQKMKAAYLPGNSTVVLKEVEIPEPGHGQVLIRTKSSTICGSDIRAIYREHLGKGPEGYQNKIAGHEPAGQIVKCGSGMRRFKEGDRVILYHISGCGLCVDCRMGYMISCTSPLRAAYGWQRDGGMAPYILADEKDCVPLPDELTYTDGAQVACGFGTVYEGLEKIGISGNNAVLVVGLGPVGLATLMLAKAMGAQKLIGVDVTEERCRIALDKKLADYVFLSGPDTLKKIRSLTNSFGVERAVDCSGHTAGRQLVIRATRKWGSIAFLGEGGTVEFNPSPDIIHDQKTIYGSWVTSIWKMEELTEKLVRWGIHPDELVTHRFTLDEVSEAYRLMAEGKCGKVAVVFDEEIM